MRKKLHGLFVGAKELAKRLKAKKRKKAYDRSKKIEEAQTRPKESLLKQKPAPKTKATSKGGTYKGKSKHAIARGRVLQAENEEGLRRMKAYKGKHKNPHTT